MSNETSETLEIVVDPYQRTLFCNIAQSNEVLRKKNLLNFFADFWGDGGLGELFASNMSLHPATISFSHSLLQYYVYAARNIFSVNSSEQRINRVRYLLEGVNNYVVHNSKAEDQFTQKLKSIQKFLATTAIAPTIEIKIYCDISENFLDELLSSSINISDTASAETLILRDICSVLKINIEHNEIAQADIIVLKESSVREKAEAIYKAKNELKKEMLVFIKADEDKDKIEIEEDYPIFWYVQENHLKKFICDYIDLYYLRYQFLTQWKHLLEEPIFDSIEEAKEFLSLGIASAYIVEVPKKNIILGENGVIKYDYITPFGTQTTNSQDESIPCPIETDSCTMSRRGNTINFTPQEIKPYTINVTSKEDVYLYKESKLEKRKSLEITVEDNGKAARINLELIENEHLREATGIHTYSSFTDLNVTDNNCCPEKRYEARCAQKISFKVNVTSNANGTYDCEKDPIQCEINYIDYIDYIDKTRNNEVSFSESRGEYTCTPTEAGTLKIRAKTESISKFEEVIIYVLPDANEIDLDISTTDKAKIIGEAAHEEKANYSINGDEKKRVKKVHCFEGTKFHIQQYCGVYRANTAQKVWNEECECVFLNSSGAKWDSPSSFTLYAPGSYTLKTTLRDNSSVSYCVEFVVFPDQSQKAQKWLMATCGIGLLTTLCWYGLNLVTFTLYCLCPLYAIHIGKKKEFYPAIRKECLLGLPILSVLFILKALYEELF